MARSTSTISIPRTTPRARNSRKLIAVTTSAPGDPLASFRLDDRLIVVTGASEGIGRAFAECFARAGALVVLASRRKDKLESVRQAIAASGGRAEVVTADVTRLDDIRTLADAVGALARENDRRL